MLRSSLSLLVAAIAAGTAAFVSSPSRVYAHRGCDKKHEHRVPTIQALLGADPSISFSSVSGEGKLLSTIRALAGKLQRWGPDEWRLVGAPPLQFSSRTLSSGVSLVYFNQAENAGRLSEDGACDVTLVRQDSDGKYSIIFKGRGSRRRRNEDVLYRLLLDAVRQDPACTLSFGIYPPSAGVARMVAKIDAACLVNKKEQYSRF